MDNNNFYSIDRLVEFGLGMSMATQMVNMMNQSMSQMNIPGSAATIPAAPEYIYVAIDNKSVGPLSSAQFSELISRQQVTKDSLVWMPGQNGWKPLQSVPALLKLIAIAPPPLPKQ